MSQRKWSQSMAVEVGCVAGRRPGLASGLTLTFALAAMLPATANAQRAIHDEYEKFIKSAEVVGALGNDVFGENTNLYTGSTSFTATDFSLRGNSELPVSLARTFTVESRSSLDLIYVAARMGGFMDWDIDIPHLQGVFAHSGGWQLEGATQAERNQRCSASYITPPVVEGNVTGNGLSVWTPTEYWHGNSLHIPGGGNQELVAAVNSTYKPTAGGPYPWVTNNLWVFSCLPTTALGNNVPGEAFLATAPNGTRYWFNWIVARPTTDVSRPGDQGGSGGAVAPQGEENTESKGGGSTDVAASPTSYLVRDEVWIMPTRIEDRHGNWVMYTYNQAKPWQITQILANDGRQITMTHNPTGQIATATAGTRTWIYTYANGSLTQVHLPDASKWSINFGPLLLAYTLPEQNPSSQQMCDVRSSSTTQTPRTGTITHPSGAIGSFTFLSTLHGRSYVPRQCFGWIEAPAVMHNYAYFPRLFDVISLTNKTINGPGQSAAAWNFSYGPPNASWTSDCTGIGCATTKTVFVTGPASFKQYTFGNRYKDNEGKLLQLETGASSSSILRTDTTTYLLNPDGQAYPALIGISGDERGDGTAQQHRPVIATQTIQQGRTFTWKVATGCTYGYCFDAFARPTKVVKSSTP